MKRVGLILAVAIASAAAPVSVSAAPAWVKVAEGSAQFYGGNAAEKLAYVEDDCGQDQPDGIFAAYFDARKWAGKTLQVRIDEVDVRIPRDAHPFGTEFTVPSVQVESVDACDPQSPSRSHGGAGSFGHLTFKVGSERFLEMAMGPPVVLPHAGVHFSVWRLEA